MPNWCSNEVTVMGDREDLLAFLNDAGYQEGTFSFSKLRPMPEELGDIVSGSITVDGKVYSHWRVGPHGESLPLLDEEVASLKEKYGASDWYSWNCANWGTKWDAHYPDFLYDGLKRGDAHPIVELRFDTAWSPPDELYAYLVRKYPSISFTWFYKEEGQRIAGWLGDSE